MQQSATAPCTEHFSVDTRICSRYYKRLPTFWNTPALLGCCELQWECHSHLVSCEPWAGQFDLYRPPDASMATSYGQGTSVACGGGYASATMPGVSECRHAHCCCRPLFRRLLFAHFCSKKDLLSTRCVVRGQTPCCVIHSYAGHILVGTPAAWVTYLVVRRGSPPSSPSSPLVFELNRIDDTAAGDGFATYFPSCPVLHTGTAFISCNTRSRRCLSVQQTDGMTEYNQSYYHAYT